MTTLLPHPLLAVAAARPDHVVLSAGDLRLTGAQLCRRVAHRATALAEAGIAAGDEVALRGEWDGDWVIDLHAIGWLGATALLTAAPDAASLPLPPRGILGEHPAPPRPWPLEEPRVILQSSGSTGAPRRVTLSSAALFFNAVGSSWRLGHHLDDRWLVCLPLDHVGGLSILWRCAWYATTAVVQPRFDAAAVKASLLHERITQVSVVPTMLARLVEIWGAATVPTALRVVLVGGAAAPEELLERARRLGLPVTPTWGMTEAASQIATALPGESGPLPPLPLVAVSAPEGHLCATLPGVGELVTEDLGVVDAQGRVVVRGRGDDVINSGGVKVHPEGVEELLRRHPAIADVAITGEADPQWGQRVVAHVVWRAGAAIPTEAQLDGWCRELLAPPQRPKRWRPLPRLPRTALGKLRRAALVDPGELEAGALHPGDEGRGDVAGGEIGAADEGVHQANPGVQPLLAAADGVGEGHRPPPEPLDAHRHGEAIAHEDRTLEVGLGVDQGHAPLAGGKALLPAPEADQEHLLEGRVAVLEEPPKEDNAGAIDLVETRGQRMLEGHLNSQTSDPTPANTGRRIHDARS